jgi:hypothetical protein
MRKDILIGFAILFLIIGLVYVIFNSIVKGMRDQVNQYPVDSIVFIKSPGCFFPSSKKSLNVLLNDLRQNPNWVVTSSSDLLKDPSLDGLLAYRVFDTKGKVVRKTKDGYFELDTNSKSKLYGYKVALIDVSKSKKQVFSSSEAGYKLTTVTCDKESFNLSVHSTFKFGTQSCLLFENKVVGLVIFEMGEDAKRSFTIETLDAIHGEFENAIK